MGEQYIRRVKLTLEGGQDVNGSSLDVSPLRFRFDLRQATTSTPHVLNVRINNLRRDNMNRALQEYKKVTLSVGYGLETDRLQTIFKGEILQARIGRENLTDTYLHVLATCGERARNFGFVNQTLAAGHTYRDRVDVALKALKQYDINPGQIADLGSAKFPRSFVAFGPVKQMLRDICEATGTSWHMHLDKINIVKNNGSMPGGTIVLNSDTGLIGLPEQTIAGIEGRCLMNPTIAPGTLVQINEKNIQRAAYDPKYTGQANADFFPKIAADGVYRIEVAEHLGDIRGPDWYTEFVGIRNGDPISAGLVSRGIGPGMERGAQ